LGYATGGYPEGPLVDATWLREHAGDARVVIADVRWKPDGTARAAFDAGHIPGAVLVDVDRDLAAPAYEGPGRHPLPTPERFAERMSELGVADEDTVVAYDDASGSLAARIWWMLRATGHRAFVLDGGLVSWPGELSTESEPRAPARFSARRWPADLIASAEDVRDAIARGLAVLDARAPERYRGEEEPIDAKAGHIPGARSAPFAENVDPGSHRFRAGRELRERFHRLGAEEEAIVYCGSGLTSCQLVLAMEAAGLPSPRLYVGSWSDWISDPTRPVATGSDPGG
jgi:thiosulfate/3-mercaptopyruvate sulfurtransferase